VPVYVTCTGTAPPLVLDGTETVMYVYGQSSKVRNRICVNTKLLFMAQLIMKIP
jgi:hypothetical protein